MRISMDPDQMPEEPGFCDLCEGCIELCRYQPFPNEYGFHKLIDAMVPEIIDLEEELVRCREALIHHLPKQFAEGLYAMPMPFTAVRIQWDPRIIQKGCSVSEKARTKPLTTIFIDIN